MSQIPVCSLWKSQRFRKNLTVLLCGSYSACRKEAVLLIFINDLEMHRFFDFFAIRTDHSAAELLRGSNAGAGLRCLRLSTIRHFTSARGRV
jgi:hypothetical protein